ncbi:hypothetical protein V2J09_022825 [Rumex salicifolius]
MFRLNKHKSVRSSDRFSFSFSSFQAVQVPKGWDKLFVSIVSLQTGKTIGKLAKASARNGNCRWTETITESLPVSQVEGSPKDLEECFIKFVVAMGSSRSSILGEANVNLARHSSSKASTPLSLPLSKCDHGTTLQLKIQCLTPRPKLRGEKISNSDLQEAPEESDEMETKSDMSGSALSRSVRSSSSNHDEILSQNGVISREPSFSESGSRHSFESVEGSSGKDSFSSPLHKFSGAVNDQIGRQDSTGSQNSIASLNFNSSDDGTRSNSLLFNSKTLVSASPHRNQREQFGKTSDAAASLFRDGGLSKELMEAAEVKIEELRAESKIWERNAKKSMLDMEALRQELSEQSGNGETLAVELSASQRECDSLKQEIAQLKSLLEDTKTKEKASGDGNRQDKNAYKMHKELEDEMRFQKQSNADLVEQLQKTQDSNVELLSILQELEGIIETQKAEISSLSDEKLKLEDRCVDSDSDLQTQLHELLQTQEKLESKIQSLESTLEEKNSEIEMAEGLKDQAVIDCESKWKVVLATKAEEIINLEAKLFQSSKTQEIKDSGSDSGHNLDLAQEVELLKMKLVELENDCNELVEENLQLALKLKEARKYLVTSNDHDALPTSLLEDFTSKSGHESSHLGPQSYDDQKEEVQRKESMVDQVTSSSQLDQIGELETKCSELEIQLQKSKDEALHLEDELRKYRVVEEQVEIQGLEQSTQKTMSEDHSSISSEALSSALSVLREQLHHYLASAKKNTPTSQGCLKSIQFYDDLDLTYSEPETEKEQIEEILKYLHQLGKLFKVLGDALENDVTEKHEDCISQLVLDSTSTDRESRDSELTEELATKVSEIEVLKIECTMKDEEIQKLLHKQTELESHISNLETRKLEESKETNKAERAFAFQQSDVSSNELLLLNTNMESQVAANKLLERKSSELEKGKEDLELHLSELEEENMQLSERISALEAQLRYLTDEKESCRLQLQHSDCEVVTLHDEIKRLEGEMEIQRVDMRQKVQDIQKRWLDAQEECEYLKKANPKLQVTVENLIEECNSLQKLNTDLKMQSIDLHTRNVMLEAQVTKSHEIFSKYSFKIGSLEAEFSSMLEEIALKEKILHSEIESLVHECKVQNEQHVAEDRLLNQLYSEKALEAENLQKELIHFIDQISATDGDNDKLASEAIHELSSLRAEKSKLESALEELSRKFSSSQKVLNEFQIESEAKMQELIAEINYSRQKHEVLVSDHEKLSAMLESVKSSEDKCKSIMHDLEVKLKASEYEKLQLSEEISVLRDQLRKTSQLQDEVVSLKNSLNEAKFENEKLNASFDLMFGDHAQLKSEKVSLAQKICNAEKAISELEDCKRGKIALQEKVLRLEGDLNAREALCAQDAELKLELSRVKRSNNELQRKLKHLKDDRDEYLRTADLSPSFHNDVVSDQKSQSKMSSLESRIQSLENELAEALEANDMYKSQLKSVLSDPGSTPSATPKASTNAKYPENAEHIYQTELKDLRERYFQMSLKYAEVEAQREELVLKLKSSGSRRSWFS